MRAIAILTPVETLKLRELVHAFTISYVQRAGDRQNFIVAEKWYAEAHAVQLRIQREMSGEQRILLEFEMSLFARELAREGIRQDHPEWVRRKSRANLADWHSCPIHFHIGLKSASRTLDRQPFAPAPHPPL